MFYRPRPDAPRLALGLALAVPLLLAGLSALALPAEAGHAGNRVGGVHWHADWAVYINGEKQSFDAQRYQVDADFVHVEGGDGDTIHVHAKGATLGEFLDTLGWSLSNDCLSTGDGEELCQSETADLEVLVDGTRVDDPATYTIQDGDELTISYRGPTVKESGLQTPAWILGGLLLLGGGGYAYRAWTRHRKLQDAGRQQRKRMREAGYEADREAEPWHVHPVQIGGAIAAVGLIAVAAGFVAFGPETIAPGPRDVRSSQVAQVHYLAYTDDGTVAQSTLAEPPENLHGNDVLFGSQLPEGEAVWTWAGHDKPRFLPPGVSGTQLEPVPPAIRTALLDHAEGDTFRVGPVRPQLAYGPVDETQIKIQDRILTLERTQTVPRGDVSASDGTVNESERVTVATDPGVDLPAIAQNVTDREVDVRLDPADGSTVELRFWNATVETTNQTVRLVQHPQEGTTYGAKGSTFQVTKVNQTHYVEDWNHPLAGEELSFRVHVVQVPPPVGQQSRDPAPTVTLDRLGGGQFTLEDEPGKVVVMTSMGAWCSTCKLEAREIGKVAPNYPNDKVQFVEVGITPQQDTMRDLASFKQNYGGDWTFTMDDGTFVRTFQVSRMDETWIITPKGNIAFHDASVTPAETFATEIDKVLEEFGMTGA